jgi:glutathione S-transferase
VRVRLEGSARLGENDDVIKLYGGKANRGGRCIIALEECGLEYELHDINLDKGEHKKPDFLGLNPNAAVPVLVDGTTVLWESMAINLYLAEKYGKNGLWPARLEDRAHVYKWTLWGIAALEPQLVTVFLNRVLLPEAERNPATADAAAAKAVDLLKTLDHELEGKKFLVGDCFTVADLNVGHVVAWAGILAIDMSATPNVRRWLGALHQRPSVQKLIS